MKDKLDRDDIDKIEDEILSISISAVRRELVENGIETSSVSDIDHIEILFMSHGKVKEQLRDSGIDPCSAEEINLLQNTHEYGIHHRKNSELRKILTERQMEVLLYLQEDKSNRQISKEFGISTATVKSHVNSIIRRLGAKGRMDAAQIANHIHIREKLHHIGQYYEEERREITTSTWPL